MTDSEVAEIIESTPQPSVPQQNVGPTGRTLPSGVSAEARAAVGGYRRWKMARWAAQLEQIESIGKELRSLRDDELRKRSLALRYQAKAGDKPATLVPEGFALVRESAGRTLQMRHFDVQLLGGMSLFHGSIAEMETGEGKTLTATLPLYVHALTGKGSHLATVNDYLARRDAEWMRPVYELLGMSVGVVETDMSRPQRREAYASDITYGTAKEFGFDFLRDRLVLRRIQQERLDFLDTLSQGAGGRRGEQPVQREPQFVLVDEADSILIDEARTPLIISAMPNESHVMMKATYEWAASVADQFQEDDHFEYDHEKRKVELNMDGRQLVRSLPHPEAMDEVGLIDAYEFVERAIKVSRDFLRDQQYVVTDDGEIVIVDENTGRLAEGRKWRDGIHQAVEAKEHVEVTVDTGQAARVTVQDYFMRYPHMAGMTGTAITSTREFRKVYKMHVMSIPTNRRKRREMLPASVFATEAEKWVAIANEVADTHQEGRPVLIGTRTIDKSEALSALLNERGIEHAVLNAHHVAIEADIIALAGQRNKVTVATNMAGRGTDIKLGDGIAELGGLHVICSEMHDSARIDRQLMGRCGRQGDPGTVRCYVSYEDEVLRTGFGPKKAKSMRKGVSPGRTDGLSARSFGRAQRKTERKHLRDRMILLHHEKQRKKMQRELGQDPYLDNPS